MENKDRIDDYLESRAQIFNFLGTVAQNYPDNSREANIIKFACHAILFCHSRDAYDLFKNFMKNSYLPDDEKVFLKSLGF